MKRLIGLCVIASLVAGVACIVERQGMLFFNASVVPPDTTSEEQVEIAGSIYRTPERQYVITVVTVEGGLVTVVDTTSNFGLFSLFVPLATNSPNYLSLTARDNAGGVMRDPWEKVVVHRDAPPAAPAEPAGEN